MILASIAVIAAQAAPLQPSSKWNVDYGKEMCTVGRSFGDDGVTFGFRPDGFAGQGGMLVVLQPAKSGARFHEFSQSIEVAGGADPIKVSAKSYFIRERESRVVTMVVNAEELGRLKAAKSFAVPISSRERIALAPGNFAAALAALDKCSDDLMGMHGVPMAEIAQATVRTTARRPEHWFTYPASPRILGAEGRIVTLIAVSDQGKPTDCRILSQNAEHLLAKSSCETIMRRGDFEPARNASGEAIRSWTTMTITYQIS